MGLDIKVGMLAELTENDPEAAGWLRDSFGSVNALLANRGLPPHREPESLPPLDNRAARRSFPYSSLHYLRRIAAHALEEPGWVATPAPNLSDPTADPLVAKHTSYMKCHLLCHSDCEGFYLPTAFNQILVDNRGQCMIGSSASLQNDLVVLAPSLGIRLHNGKLKDAESQRLTDVHAQAPLSTENHVWLCLFEAARLSIQYETAIYFC